MKPVDVGSTVQMQAKRSILTIETDRDVGYVNGGARVYLGAFGAVGKMTAETVDYLLHVLEDVGIVLTKVKMKPVLSGLLSSNCYDVVNVLPIEKTRAARKWR